MLGQIEGSCEGTGVGLVDGNIDVLDDEFMIEVGKLVGERDGQFAGKLVTLEVEILLGQLLIEDGKFEGVTDGTVLGFSIGNNVGLRVMSNNIVEYVGN